jgi:hypothetical protein
VERVRSLAVYLALGKVGSRMSGLLLEKEWRKLTDRLRLVNLRSKLVGSELLKLLYLCATERVSITF